MGPWFRCSWNLHLRPKPSSPVIQVRLEVLGHPTWSYLHGAQESSGKENSLEGKRESKHGRLVSGHQAKARREN